MKRLLKKCECRKCTQQIVCCCYCLSQKARRTTTGPNCFNLIAVLTSNQAPGLFFYLLVLQLGIIALSQHVVSFVIFYSM